MHDELTGVDTFQDTFQISEVPAGEWVPFAGGELEGHRPVAACASCRLREPGRAAPLCFECYRAGMARRRAKGGGEETPRASRLESGLWSGLEAPGSAGDRWSDLLPFEPVNRPRLAALKRARAQARVAGDARGRFHDRRRRAQIAARAALRDLAEHMQHRAATGTEGVPVNAVPRASRADAVLAADLRLPESWLRFVVSA